MLLDERVYIRPWRSEPERELAYAVFLRFFKQYRAHEGESWSTPATALAVFRDNFPAVHN